MRKYQQMANSTLPTSPETFLKTTSILHIALFSGQIILAGIMLFLKGNYVIHTSATDGVFLYLVPGMAVLALFMGKRVYDNRIDTIEASAPLQEKLDNYRGALIVNLALVEGASLLGIMSYYITGNLLYILIAFALILYFFYLKPTTTAVKRDAKLTQMELEQIS